MKRIVTVIVAIMLAVLAIVPMTAACADSTTMYASSSNGKGVRMRAAASTDAKVLYQLNEGTKVTVLSYINADWAYVKAEGRSTAGYVMRKFLSSTDPTTLKQSFSTVTPYTVTVNPTSAGCYVNMRASASKKAASIAQMHKGEQLTVIAVSRAFFKVVTANGTTGYVVKAYVK